MCPPDGCPENQALSTHQSLSNHQWKPEPEAAEWIGLQLTRLCHNNPLLNDFSRLLNSRVSGRLIDWIDHLELQSLSGIEESGYREVGNDWYTHSGALLPPVQYGHRDNVYLKVDSVTDFVAANRWRFPFRLHGGPLDPVRSATIELDAPAGLGVVERHGISPTASSITIPAETRVKTLSVFDEFVNRERTFPSEEHGFDALTRLVDQAILDVGQELACDAFFRAERSYWQSRNRAAQVQYMRQQSLGLGWGNHDHHTYRSSRTSFHRLIAVFEQFGFQCRERFYAGAEAGWGAQVLEHGPCGIVIFADVDLSASELSNDFAHQPLDETDTPGTIGLWCALHGEAVFQAGMHHLECQFDFDLARAQLLKQKVRCMPPFTETPYLQQCFTEGERWAVAPYKITRALENNWITDEQAQRFLAEGAIGSHLEILERNDGYRGFNQSGINDIIKRTDPRAFGDDLSPQQIIGQILDVNESVADLEDSSEFILGD
ncbi:MAG: hypothetical protein KDA91_02990 [Planctomycetaceae bacterium]|nr:hypothetical protein [Planctomycetaceae bacterium]